MPNQELVRIQLGKPSPLCRPDAWWPVAQGEEFRPETILFLEGLCHSYQDRLQRLQPHWGKNYYYSHHRKFIEGFLDRHINVRDTPELVLIGRESEFNRVESIVKARRKTIAEVSGREPKKIAVFIGSGAIMDENYRAIGFNNPPFYTHAIAGALDVYLNTNLWHNDFFNRNPLDPDRPLVRRVIGHEPSHALWNGVFVDKDGNPTWQLDTNRMVYEALAGPLNQKGWEDVDTSEITSVDFTPLEAAVAQIANRQPAEDNLQSWLNTTSERNGGYSYNPLASPIWALFYKWASQKGDERFWYKLGEKL